MFCPVCKEPIPDGSLSCPICGSDLTGKPKRPMSPRSSGQKAPTPKAPAFEAPAPGAPVPPTPEPTTSAPLPQSAPPTRPPKNQDKKKDRKTSPLGRFLQAFGIGCGAMLLLVIILLLTGVLTFKTGTKKASVEGSGYKTPEEALTAYAEALSAKDIDGMTATFAVESFTKNMDPGAYADYTGSITIGLVNGYPLIPNDTDLSDELYVNARASEINLQITYLLMNAYGCTLDSGVCIKVPENSNGSDYLSSTYASLKNLDSLNVVVGEIVDATSVIPDLNLMQMASLSSKRQLYLGADELTYKVIEVTINGQPGYLTMECARYGKRWYNMSTNNYLSMAAGLDAQKGGLIK